MKQIHIIHFPGILLAMLVLFPMLFTASSLGQHTGKQVYLVFRYDDYAWNSATDVELKILDAFREINAPISFGVIPFKVKGDVHNPGPQELVPLDSVKAQILKSGYEEGILEISMHGYAHQANSVEYLSEFAHLDKKVQVEKLSEGKKALQQLTGATVSTFIPPWNTYDLNTLSAMEETGFSTLAANKKGLFPKGLNINYLPSSCVLPELKDAIQAARKSSDRQPLVVALVHDYDFLDLNPELGEITLQEFQQLIAWVGAQEDVRILSLNQASEVIEDLSAERAQRTKRIYYLEKVPPLSLGSSMLLYQESPGLAWMILKMAAFYSVFLVIGIVILRWIWKKGIRKT